MFGDIRLLVGNELRGYLPATFPYEKCPSQWDFVGSVQILPMFFALDVTCHGRVENPISMGT